jgi:4-carboxymuconolactone decarboxylase
MTRQPRLRPDDLDTAQERLHRSITEGLRGIGPQLFALADDEGVLQGPFGGFLLSPDLGDALQQLGAAVRYRTTLPDRVREMSILAVAARWHSDFERRAHEAVGAACGLTAEEMHLVSEGRSPGLDNPVEAAALRLTWALLDDDVDDATWAACVPPLDTVSVFELTTLVGYYSTLALQMRVLRVDGPA